MFDPLSYTPFERFAPTSPASRGRNCVFPPPFTGEVSRTKGVTEGAMRDSEKRSRKFAKALRKNLTDAEVILWESLRRKQLGGFRFRRQHPIGPYIADFACPMERLVIELDGWTHSSDAEITHDANRTTYLESQGWSVLRFENEDVLNHLGQVLEHIEDRLRGGKASPRSSAEIH